MNKFVNRSLLFITVFVCICTAAGFLARSWWFFELFSHFRVQYFIVLAACGVIYVGGRKYREAILVIAFALVNFSFIDAYRVETPVQASVTSNQKRTLRAVLVNVNHNNQAYGEVNRFIRSTNADFIILLEVTKAWMKSLNPLRKYYPYTKSEANGPGGIALLSRIPFDGATIGVIGGIGLPSIIARFSIDGERLTLIGTHPYSPVSRRRAENRDQQLTEVAKFISHQADPILLLGDLNTSPWSPIFKDFLRGAGLRDSREGFGLQPSWPTWFPPAWIPIDHVLVSSNVTVYDRKIERDIGSDHYPVVVDFSVTASH